MASSLHKFQFALRLCEDHNKKKLHAYCKTCEKEICSSCIKEDHRQHDWETITDILKEKRRTLPGECRVIRAKYLPNLEKEIGRFDRKIQREDANLDKNKTVLNNSRQCFINEINKLFDDRIDICQQKHDKGIQIYKDKREILKRKVVYLDMMTTSLDKDINTLPDHDILDMEKEMKDELEKALSYSSDKYACSSVFVPLQIDTQALMNMIGEIYSLSMEETNVNVKQSDVISSINPVSETKAWVMTVHENYAKLIDINGQEQRSMNTLCDNFTISRRGEFVLTDENMCMISVLTKDEELIRTIDTSPLYPTFARNIENDDMLVILRDDGDNFDLAPTSRRIVQRMTLTGKVLHTYEFREDGKTRLFTLPIKTTENKNTDICVVNRLSKDSGELTVLHKDGRVKFTYRGDALKTKKFCPVDVDSDYKSHILLSEIHSRAIHMLSSNGEYLCALCQFDRMVPFVISLHGYHLWCVFNEGTVQVFSFTLK